MLPLSTGWSADRPHTSDPHSLPQIYNRDLRSAKGLTVNAAKTLRCAYPWMSRDWRKAPSAATLGCMNSNSLTEQLDQWQTSVAPVSSLWGEILAPNNLRSACRKVVGNGGAPGVDGMRVQELENHVRKSWPLLKANILSGRYAPLPVRVVEIPKPGGGVRRLGIPCVLDRFLQQAISQVLSPRFEREFSEFSFAYRPGRTAHGAVAAMQRYVVQGFPWVAHLDIEKFFDTVTHDTVLSQLCRQVDDPLLIQLIRSWLQAGAWVGGARQESPEGTPQGSPLSPLLSNIVLHDLDQGLQTHGIPFVRYADDCVLLAESYHGAKRNAQLAADYLAEHLRLTLNREKTKIARAHETTFLGFTFDIGQDGRSRREVAPSAWVTFQSRVEELTIWHPHLTFESMVAILRQYVTGWSRYYGFSETPTTVAKARAIARTRVREFLWQSWRTPERRLSELRRRGIPSDAAQLATKTNRSAASAARSYPLTQALPNRFFTHYDLGDFQPLPENSPRKDFSEPKSILAAPEPVTQHSQCAPLRKFHCRLPWLGGSVTLTLPQWWRRASCSRSPVAGIPH